MHITKVLCTTIDLLDPNEIYTPDIDSLLIKKLEARYKQRCFSSMLILGINKIIRRSSIRMEDNRLDGAAHIDVQFEVNGIIFTQGEILLGCKIIEIHANAITAEHKYAGIKLQKDKTGMIFKILKVGQKIPVLVDKVRYMPNQSAVSMIAKPYIPSSAELITETYYNITSKLSVEDTEKIISLLDQVKAEEKEHISIKEKKVYEIFKDFMYPYKNNQKFEQSKKAMSLKLKPVNFELESLMAIEGGLVIMPPSDQKSNARLFHTIDGADILEQEEGSNIVICNATSYVAFSDIINKYLLYLQALRSFVETYPSPDGELLTYWNVCKSLKL